MEHPEVPKTSGCPKAAASPWAKAHEGDAPGGISDHGAREEDGSATWEALVPPTWVGRRRGTTTVVADGDKGVGGPRSNGEAGERLAPDPAE